MIFNRAGRSGVASATSKARTANPSIALLANGGTGSGATTVSASTSPSASPTGLDCGSKAEHAANTSATASSREITECNACEKLQRSPSGVFAYIDGFCNAELPIANWSLSK